ncbi:MBL fold metallo-hydrolase [Paludibacterium paludis]|uniref:MBL fold metallo-hydrolase n=1 Tax=Paludibacterium paludis TaxID=1225769 RepID=A0A918U7W9_9NEIS|nr:MBL fold metallo-hydrolase [Paludibacterium paludis]GGY06470.1 MBL fold metallo-hydrolase [Paludibacterium paludis]
MALRNGLAALTEWLTGNPHRNVHYNPDRGHHTPSGFRNNYPHGGPGPGDLARWRRERKAAGLPKPPLDDLSCLPADLGFLQANRGERAVTFIGHVTLLWQTAGLNLLTDPVFSERCSPLPFAGPRRHQPPGVALDALPHINAVLLSHNHYDHLDRASVRRLAAQKDGPPRFFVPLGMDAWFRANLPLLPADHIIALDWWESAAIGEVALTFVPVQHWSARTPFDRNATLWGGWIIGDRDWRAFFSGDLGDSRDIDDIAARFAPFDFCALGIGAYEPRWFMKNQHINPFEAVDIHRRLRSRESLGIHWGTFELTDESLDEPPRELARARAAAGIGENEFYVLRPGQTRRLG